MIEYDFAYKNIDSFLLNGSPTEYQFTNADLNGFSVDESLVDNFTLIPDYEGAEETIEVLYVGDQNMISTDTVILLKIKHNSV